MKTKTVIWLIVMTILTIAGLVGIIGYFKIPALAVILSYWVGIIFVFGIIHAIVAEENLKL